MTAIVSKGVLMPHRRGWGILCQYAKCLNSQRPCSRSGCNIIKAHQVEPKEHSFLVMCKVRLKSREKGGGRSLQLLLNNSLRIFCLAVEILALNQTLMFTSVYQKIADLSAQCELRRLFISLILTLNILIFCTSLSQYISHSCTKQPYGACIVLLPIVNKIKLKANSLY